MARTTPVIARRLNGHNGHDYRKQAYWEEHRVNASMSVVGSGQKPAEQLQFCTVRIGNLPKTPGVYNYLQFPCKQFRYKSV
jgi:hypothetical protein